MTYHFVVSQVATRETYLPNGMVIQPGTVRPITPQDELAPGWRYQVERVESTPEPPAPAPDVPPPAPISPTPPTIPPGKGGGHRAA